jgi:hypothetical protein
MPIVNGMQVNGSDGSTSDSLPSTFDATCAGSNAIGDFVYLVSTGVVSLADPTDALKMPAIGVIETKPTVTTCTVRVIGETAVFTGLTVGKTHWVSLTGQAATAPPIAPSPGAKARVQTVGIATSSTSLYLMPNPNYFIRGA